MIIEFLSQQLKQARYEMIEKGNRYYGEIPGLRGVWATGKTLEGCRQNLLEVLEGWFVVRLKKNLSIPRLRLTLTKNVKAQINV